MDAKVMEMNNLRVLHDYLNQTIDVLTRGQRMSAPFGYSPFGTSFPTPGGNTDVVWGQSPWGYSGSPMFSQASFGPTTPFPTFPTFPTGYSPFGTFGGTFSPWQQPWQQWSGWPQGFQPTWPQGFQPTWSPATEAARQAQVNQALAARQQVLEAMCRIAGIPV